MATLYGLPDDDVTNLLSRALADYHPELSGNGVKVQILMATSDNDTPAVKSNGYPAVATVRVVQLRDRITKNYDAELLLDRDHWQLCNERHRLALLDHELMHLEVKKKKVKMPKGYKGEPQYMVDLDDLGRPKLKLRKGDFNVGDGFKSVIIRHGNDADEFAAIRRAYAIATQALSESDSSERS